MWARHMELSLGLWLALSPMIFSHAEDRVWMWLHDFGVALVIVVLSLLAHWPPLRRAHLALLAVSAWLVGAGWWLSRGAGIHPDPAYQNWILVGLLLAMFAIVPGEASRPPQKWRRATTKR